MKTIKSMQEGFTLVELMVVVAIIGVLSAVAIPNFKKYQAKAKTSEAKLQLSSVYAAETAFMADSDSYGTCLGDMGYNPSNERTARYYAVGFSAAKTFNGDEINGVTCTGATNFQYDAGKVVAGANATVNYIPTKDKDNTPTTVPADGGTFVAGAGGPIDTSYSTADNCDQWTVNQNKFFVHVRTGY